MEVDIEGRGRGRWAGGMIYIVIGFGLEMSNNKVYGQNRHYLKNYGHFSKIYILLFMETPTTKNNSDKKCNAMSPVIIPNNPFFV